MMKSKHFASCFALDVQLAITIYMESNGTVANKASSEATPVVRFVTENDRKDVEEMARNTYGGTDHIMNFFDGWLSSDTCLTAGIEVDGTKNFTTFNIII